jgi:glycosyltransferase involved in cell wall biosynthesis
MAKTTALFSVIFPANVSYLKFFFDSLAAQSDQDFEVLLVVDGVEQAEALLEPFASRFSIRILHCTGSIAAIRQQGLKWLSDQQHDYIIFADADDLLSSQRVEVCKKYLSMHSVVVNDLIPFEDPQQIGAAGFWKDRLAHETIFGSDAISSYNFVGLGNTAIRKNVLTFVSIPEEIKVVDWFLFYHWLQENKGIFVHTGNVLYRQHGDNLAGIRLIDEARLKYIIDVKIRHYMALVKRFPELQQHVARLETLTLKLSDARYRETEIAYLNTKRINYFWWEETEYLHE